MLPGFINRYGARLAADEIDILSRVAASPACPLFTPLEGRFCLEHVDYRLDNMLIDERSMPPRVTVVDWQSVKVGRPLNDVGYFLGAGLEPTQRRKVEQDIVHSYHSALQQAGIEAFDWHGCWEAYRRSTFAGFAVTVIASMIVQQTPRGDEMFLTMARRHSRHALDLGAAEFLG
jgi:aminoglycoside phosphotransferase (APT) family kinase protein